MVYSLGEDCNGLNRLMKVSAGGLWVPRGASQQQITIANSATILVPGTVNPTPRMLYFFNKSANPATIYLAINASATISNYTYQLPQGFFAYEILDGGDQWSGMTEVGKIATVNLTVIPLVKI